MKGSERWWVGVGAGGNFESQAPREAVPFEINSILRISNTLILWFS